VLFSAHSLPQSVIDRGDPYQWQIEQSAAAIRALLPADWETRACYQSRVGPLRWLGPSTEEEIRAAGADQRGVIICPIAFVSEHVETLVELDIEYAALAKGVALPFYLRAAAPGDNPVFIEGLADLAERAMATPGAMQSEAGARLCPRDWRLCPLGGSSQCTT
jgi:ferrochelatase